MIQIIRDLFVNLAIITSIVMFANMLMHEKYLVLSKLNNIRNGILSGMLGCLLMLFSVRISDQVILDFRFIPVMMMALYVSTWASLETAVIIGGFRIAYFGLNRASVLALAVVILIGFGAGMIGRTRFTIRTKWLLSVGLTGLLTGSSIIYLIQGLPDRNAITAIYLLGLTIVSGMLYFFIEFVASFNRKIERFKDEAEKDFLTGLKTPRQFDRTLEVHIEAARADQRSLALLYMDIDHFKQINDQFGHEGGDLVLKEIGRILRKMARTQDIVSRKGGEEFTMILLDCQLAQAEMVAERIRRAVESCEFRLPNHQSINITVSIGVAAIPETTSEKKKLVEMADRALYQAKQTGRNKVTSFRS